MKKLLISLIILFSLFLGINSVSALDTLSGTYPDPPEITDNNYSNKNYLIYKNTSNVTRLLIIPNEAKNIYTSLYEVSTDRLINKNTSGNSFFPTTSTTTNDFTNNNSLIYDLKNNSWVSSGKGKSFMWSEIYYSTLPIQGTDFTGQNSKPTLKYKTGFVSSEAYNVLGKVSVEFSETDTNIYKYKKSQFKLQFGSNDFSKEYIPIFSHYKVFGKRSGTWTELTEEQLKFPYDEDEEGNIIYDDRRLVTIDTTYDYSEGMLADASITFEINYSNLVDISTTNPIYTDWKIEFYFDNTDNSYIYVYDTLNSSTWTDTAKFLEDYIFYYFPPGYRYAFISSEESSTQGRIYFPMNHYNNEAVRFRGYNYDYSKNMVMTDLSRGISENDNYYMYFDFDINNNDKKCVVLSRKLGSLYSTYYDPNFLNNYLKLFPDVNLVFDSEMSYFYAPIGVKVTFSKGLNDSIIIHTPSGVINNDSNIIYDTNDNLNDINSTLNLFSSKSYLTGQAFQKFSEIWNKFKQDTGIYTYLLMVVLSSIALLLIKSFRK